MHTTSLRTAVAVSAILIVCASGIGAGHAAGRRSFGRHETAGSDKIFAALAGTWSGTGTVSLMGGGADRLVCRAVYRPIDAAQIGLDLHCVSPTFTLGLDGTMTRDGSKIAGTWHEQSVGISGQIDGTVSGQRINAIVEGMGDDRAIGLECPWVGAGDQSLVAQPAFGHGVSFDAATVTLGVTRRRSTNPSVS